MNSLLSRLLCAGMGVCLAWGGLWPAQQAISQTEPPTNTDTLAPEAPDAGGAITGRVIDADTGNGIAFTQISVNRYDDTSGFKLGIANANGYFTITNILTGVYAVSFDAPQPYLSERYDNAPRAAANPPALIAVGVGITATNVNAALRKGFVITGTVTDQATGTPLSNVQVRAERGDGTSFGNVTASTSGSGKYTLGPLEAGDYRLRFAPPSNDPHAAQWHTNATSYAAATLLNVIGNLADVNAALAYGSAITGTVSNATGEPVAGVAVSIFPAGVVSPAVASATSGADGQYVTSPGLAPGVYQAFFATPNTSVYLDSWYANESSQLSARLITVTNGISTTDVNLQLGTPNGGGITGLLLAADTGAILTGTVSLYRNAVFLDSVRTDQGAYTLTGLLPGAYKLHFAASTPTPYAFAFLGGGVDVASSTPVNVSAGVTTTGVNQALPLAGGLSGSVTSGGTPVPGVFVVATGAQSYSTYTGPEGAYSFAELRSGAYRVAISPPPPFVAGLVSVTVTAGLTITANAEVGVGGRITGTVLAQDTNAPLGGATVRMEQAAAPNAVYVAYADLDGRYASPGLPSGSYTVSVQPGAYWGQYFGEFYLDAGNAGSATRVNVTSPNNTVNIALTPARGGTLTGLVCSGTGFPVAGSVSVSAFNATTGQLAQATSPNAFGFYQLAVPPGAYKVRFSSAGFFTRWYGGGANLASATPVTVAGTSNTPNIGLCLSLGSLRYLPLVRR